jgi:hypothetical protein
MELFPSNHLPCTALTGLPSHFLIVYGVPPRKGHGAGKGLLSIVQNAERPPRSCARIAASTSLCGGASAKAAATASPRKKRL